MYMIGIKEAAELLGITPKTLRLWEKNGKITSYRTEGQHRRYAAINLRNKSVSYTESACGVPKQLDTLVSGGAMNQEVNNNVQHCVSFI
jgi:putative resolvase